MRGAQPATSAGARLFAGSPIPALFTTPQRVVKKSIPNLLCLKARSLDEHVSEWPAILDIHRNTNESNHSHAANTDFSELLKVDPKSAPSAQEILRSSSA